MSNEDLQIRSVVPCTMTLFETFLCQGSVTDYANRQGGILDDHKLVTHVLEPTLGVLAFIHGMGMIHRWGSALYSGVRFLSNQVRMLPLLEEGIEELND